MTGTPRSSGFVERVVSRREARLVFWLVVLALLFAVLELASAIFGVLAQPAVIVFVAWLVAYVLEPPVSWLKRHLPFHSRGLAVAVTYVLTAVIAIVVLGAALIAILNAAVAFVDNLPAILTRIGDVVRPIIEALGISLPSRDDVVNGIVSWFSQNGAALTAAVRAAIGNVIGLVAALITSVIISVGFAAGQVSLLGWLHRFLPSSSYRDLSELERAIATSFGGFVRGRLVIGSIYGLVICGAAVLLGVPYGPLIGVIAGLIVFIPWIGPLLGWAVLPAFALIVAPDVVGPAALVSIAAALVIQLLVTQLVMGATVKMSPVAVLVAVMFGSALAGVIGAIFAIPVAAAILAVADYLRQRDALLAADEDARVSAPAVTAGDSEATAPTVLPDRDGRPSPA
jgi:predicted PurR-regulated permease PerM